MFTMISSGWFPAIVHLAVIGANGLSASLDVDTEAIRWNENPLWSDPQALKVIEGAVAALDAVSRLFYNDTDSYLHLVWKLW